MTLLQVHIYDRYEHYALFYVKFSFIHYTKNYLFDSVRGIM